MPEELMKQAIAACKAGRKGEARRLLDQVLQLDRANEAAWLWMSGVVETDDERKACLEYVLDINPGNQVARRGLTRLEAADSTDSAKAPPERSANPRDITPPATPYRYDAAQQPSPSAHAEARPRPVLSNPPLPAAQPSTVGPLLKLVAGLLVVVVVATFGYLLLSSASDSLPDLSWLSTELEGSGGEPEWQTFTSREGHFTISLPGEPSLQVEPVPTAVGTIHLHVFTVETGDFGYLVGYGDYPPSFVSNANRELMLDGARDGAVSNVNGRLVSERRIRFQGFPGRDLWIEATFEGQAAVAQARIILVGNRLYQAVVVGLKEQFADSQADRCLNSLRVIR